MLHNYKNSGCRNARHLGKTGSFTFTSFITLIYKKMQIFTIVTDLAVEKLTWLNQNCHAKFEVM